MALHMEHLPKYTVEYNQNPALTRNRDILDSRVGMGIGSRNQKEDQGNVKLSIDCNQRDDKR